MKVPVIMFFIFSTQVLARPPFHVVTCKVAVNKGYEPEATCTKTDLKEKHSKAFAKKAHANWLKDLSKKSPGLACESKLEKDRTYYQQLTICHNKTKTSFRVYTSHIPRDFRAVMFVNGLKMKWHEKKMSYYLHNKLLLPQAEYKAWLLTE